MSASAKTARQPWEELDDDLEAGCAAVAPEQAAKIDESLGLQMISIRLERSLLKNLKLIAAHHQIGYQPLIRDLLNRFARSEMQTILNAELEKINQATEDQESMELIDDFLAREGQRKRA